MTICTNMPFCSNYCFTFNITSFCCEYEYSQLVLVIKFIVFVTLQVDFSCSHNVCTTWPNCIWIYQLWYHTKVQFIYLCPFLRLCVRECHFIVCLKYLNICRIFLTVFWFHSSIYIPSHCNLAIFHYLAIRY